MSRIGTAVAVLVALALPAGSMVSDAQAQEFASKEETKPAAKEQLAVATVKAGPEADERPGKAKTRLVVAKADRTATKEEESAVTPAALEAPTATETPAAQPQQHSYYQQPVYYWDPHWGWRYYYPSYNPVASPQSSHYTAPDYYSYRFAPADCVT